MSKSEHVQKRTCPKAKFSQKRTFPKSRHFAQKRSQLCAGRRCMHMHVGVRLPLLCADAAPHAPLGHRHARRGSASVPCALVPRVGRQPRDARSRPRARTCPVSGAPRPSPADHRTPSARFAVDAAHGLRACRTPSALQHRVDGQACLRVRYGVHANLCAMCSISSLYV